MSSSGALSAGTVSLGVKPDTNGFGKQLGAQISKEASSSGLSGIGKVIGGTLVAGIGAAMVGIGAIVATGIGEAKDASAGTAQLAAGIKSTGNAANVSVKGMNDLASSIQSMSGQTDDSIVASEKLLLTFTNIKNQGPEKIFDQATLAAANMAAKMGGDAASQSILLGKALNDPVKGITALTRVGVSFSDGQKASIKAMVDSGDTMGAQKVILAELNKEFGGAAKAAGDSLPGQLARGQRAFEDLSQSVVETFLPIVTPAITAVVDGLKKFAPIAQDVAVKVKDFLVKAFKDAQPVLTVVWGILKNLGSFFVTTLVPALSSFGTWVKNNSKWLMGLAVVVGSMIAAFKAYQLVLGIVKIATIAWTVVQTALDVALNANPIGIIVIAIAALVAGIIWVATQTTFFQDAWTVMVDIFQNSVGMFADFFTNTAGMFGDFFSNTFGMFSDFLTNTGGMFTDFYNGVIQPVIDGIAGVFKWLYNNIIFPIITGIMIYIGLWAALVQWLWQVAIAPVIGAIGALFTWLNNTVIQPVFAAMGAVFRWVYESIIKPIFAGISAAIRFVAAVIGAALGVIAGVWQSVWSGISSFFGAIWSGIVGFVTVYINTVLGIVTSVVGVISGIWNGAWSGISSFFGTIWGAIVSAVQSFGGFFKSAFDGIAGFVTNAFSGVLGAVKGPINGIIGIINGAIDALNSVSVTIPGWVPVVGGQSFGLSLPHIPHLADSGTVLPRPGGTLAVIAEGGKAESVVDTGKLNKLIDAATKSASGVVNHWNINEVSDPVGTALAVARRQQMLGV